MKIEAHCAIDRTFTELVKGIIGARSLKGKTRAAIGTELLNEVDWSGIPDAAYVIFTDPELKDRREFTPFVTGPWLYIGSNLVVGGAERNHKNYLGGGGFLFFVNASIPPKVLKGCTFVDVYRLPPATAAPHLIELL